MTRLLILLLFLAALGPVEGQESETDEAASEAAAEADSASTDATDPADDSDLDAQVYEEDDDDFVPTQEIPADEPIPFPSNI